MRSLLGLIDMQINAQTNPYHWSVQIIVPRNKYANLPLAACRQATLTASENANHSSEQVSKLVPCCLQTGYIDYDKLEEKALDFRPKLIISGGSAYPREWDYKRLREIANKVGALLMTDMAHIRCRIPCTPQPPISTVF